MILIRDLEVNAFYRSERNPLGGARWIVVRKDPCIGGFEVEFTTVQSGEWWPTTTTERLDPDHKWPVVLDEYLISEEPR